MTDPVQDLVASLAATRQEIAEVRKLINAKAPATDDIQKFKTEITQLTRSVQSMNPDAVLNAAERGARANASTLQFATDALERAKIEAEGHNNRFKRIEWPLIVVALLGAILSGGAVYPNSEIACNLAGGVWWAGKGNKLDSCALYSEP